MITSKPLIITDEETTSWLTEITEPTRFPLTKVQIEFLLELAYENKTVSIIFTITNKLNTFTIHLKDGNKIKKAGILNVSKLTLLSLIKKRGLLLISSEKKYNNYYLRNFITNDKMVFDLTKPKINEFY